MTNVTFDQIWDRVSVSQDLNASLFSIATAMISVRYNKYWIIIIIEKIWPKYFQLIAISPLSNQLVVILNFSKIFFRKIQFEN